jgi:hypothetical protein
MEGTAVRLMVRRPSPFISVFSVTLWLTLHLTSSKLKSSTHASITPGNATRK